MHVSKMADLLNCLLKSLDPSHATQILTNFIAGSGCQVRDPGFFESSKAVLLALREKGDLQESLVGIVFRDICLPFLYDKDFASSDRARYRRQCLHQVYDLITLCCSIFPGLFLAEVCQRCIQAIGAYITEENRKFLEISDGFLDVSVALDLIGYLVKCEYQDKRLITEELEEKIFQQIVNLLPHTSETLCAKLTSVILPGFLDRERNERIEVLWNVVQEISESETSSADKSSITFHKSYAILCGLAEFFFDSNVTANITAPTLDICRHFKFWEIIQKGIVLMEPLTLRRTVFLLKKGVNLAKEGSQELAIGNEGDPIFRWDPVKEEEYLGVWQEYILLMEILDEKQVHLINPVLPRVVHVVTNTEKRSDGYPVLDVSWITTLYHRASQHENRFIQKWAALSFLAMDLEKSPILDPSHWRFLFGPLMGMLNEFSIYSRGEDCIRGDVPPVGQAIVQFFSRFVEALPVGERVAFLCQLLCSIEKQGFEEVPLLFLSQALAEVSPCLAWDGHSLSIVKKILAQLYTHDIHLRSSLQCFLLKAVVKLTNTTKVSWSAIENLLSSERLEESVVRGTLLWKQICDLFWRIHCSQTEVTLSDYLKMNIDKLLKDDSAEESARNLTMQALVRMLLIATDAHFLFSAGSGNPLSPIIDIFQQLIGVIQKASTHVYASEKKVLKASLLLSVTLEYLCPNTSHGIETVRPGEQASTNDPTASVVLSMFTSCFQEILSSLLRKLTQSFQEHCDLHSGGVYLQLAEQMFRVFITGSEPNLSSKQFHGFLRELTGRASLTSTSERLQRQNLSLDEWGSLVLATKCLALVCTSIRAKRTHFEDALVLVLGQTISQLTLRHEFKKPTAIPRNDITNSDASAVTSVDWNVIVLDAIESQWICVEFILEENQLPSFREGHQIVLGPFDVSPKDLLMKALDVLSVAPRKAALPTLRCVGILIPAILNEDESLGVIAVEAVWRAFQNRQRREHRWFWHTLRETTAVLFSGPLLSLQQSHPLTSHIRDFWKELVTVGEDRPGILNQVVAQCCTLWSGASVPDSICRLSSLSHHIGLVQEALLFGPHLKKAQYVINDVIEYLRCLDDESITSALKYRLHRSDARPRVDMINTLLTLNPRDTNHVTFLRELIRSLIRKDAEMSQEMSRSRLNSSCHRRKQRVWQTVLVLLPRVLTSEEFAADLLEDAFSALSFDNQTSVRVLLEWTMVLTLGRFPTLHSLLWQQMTYNTSKRAGSLTSLITVATLVGQYCFSDPSSQSSYFCLALSAILPWSLTTHVQTRMYAQVAVQKIWGHCRENRLEDVMREHAILQPCVAFMSENVQGFRQKCRLVQNFFLFDVHPCEDHTIQSLFYTVPRLAGVNDDEWIAPEFFIQNPLGKRVWNTEHDAHRIPLYNRVDSQLAQMTSVPRIDLEARINKQLANRMAGLATDEGKADDVRETSVVPQGRDVQQKIMPWKIVPPDAEIIAELEEQRLLTLQKSSAGNLVVVASLIDRAPNLGGLCRTCEIFGAQTLVLGNKHVLDDFQFKSLSVSSGKWMSIEEVKPAAVKGYLEDMRRRGYTLIGVEQTANSVNLTQYQFPQKSLLLLGHEKEGIPVELIQVLDQCVEIPQVGVIRSLNVHVSGALLIWEYTRQRMVGKEAPAVQRTAVA